MSKPLTYADVRLNYDPAQPQQRFRDAGLEAAFATPAAQLPTAPPWPADGKPAAVILDPAPNESDALTQFAGYDALIMTWTSAEASALAALLTPGHPISEWFEYRHNIAEYIPLVTGSRAPFNDTSKEMARYYHSLGLYFPCTIGSARVLLFKSGLHLAYDGPQIPLKKLVTELAQTVKPKIFITTGTAGGIGTDALLSDVVTGPAVRFDCTGQFKGEPWKDASFTSSPLPAGALAAITPALLHLNSSRVPGSRTTPTIWTGPTNAIVTTDVFAFDDSTDHYGLQGLGRVCEMGDAMVATAITAIPGQAWYAVRNVSDPQIPNPNNNLKEADEKAAQIYAKYGGLTTAASVVTSWAIVYATSKDTAKKSHHEAHHAKASLKAEERAPVAAH